MSMETANILLRDWKDINRVRGGRMQQQKQSTLQQSPYPGTPVMHDQPMDQISGDMDRMQLGNEPPPPPKTPDYYRQSPQIPTKDLRQDPRMAPPMQPQSPYPPGTPTSGQRPLPPSGPAGRPAFPTEPMQPPMQGRAPPSAYEQDPYAYQVRSLRLR